MPPTFPSRTISGSFDYVHTENYLVASDSNLSIYNSSIVARRFLHALKFVVMEKQRMPLKMQVLLLHYSVKLIRI